MARVPLELGKKTRVPLIEVWRGRTLRHSPGVHPMANVSQVKTELRYTWLKLARAKRRPARSMPLLIATCVYATIRHAVFSGELQGKRGRPEHDSSGNQRSRSSTIVCQILKRLFVCLFVCLFVLFAKRTPGLDRVVAHRDPAAVHQDLRNIAARKRHVAEH